MSVFSHLLKGLRMGCPPHGGIALGNGAYSYVQYAAHMPTMYRL